MILISLHCRSLRFDLVIIMGVFVIREVYVYIMEGRGKSLCVIRFWAYRFLPSYDTVY